MKANIITIGNSKGIRLRKSILDAYKFENEVEIILEKDHIIIKPSKNNPRKGWAEAFQEMNRQQDDDLLMPDVFEDENFDE